MIYSIFDIITFLTYIYKANGKKFRGCKNSPLHAYGYSEFCGSGSKIVYIRLPHRLYTALPNGHIDSIGKQKLFSNLPDVVHVHQKALMTAQEAPIAKFFFDGI